MTPEDKKRLEEIEERVEMATEGPWIGKAPFRNPRRRPRLHFVQTHTKDFPLRIATGLYMSDAHFIAESRVDIPWLIELARDLEKEAMERMTEDAKLFKATREKIEQLQRRVTELEKELGN